MLDSLKRLTLLKTDWAVGKNTREWGGDCWNIMCIHDTYPVICFLKENIITWHVLAPLSLVGFYM